MFDLFEKIEEAIRDLLTNIVSSSLTNMFTDVNERTGEIAAQVGKTPQGWNSSIFDMIHSLSDSVIVPIAGLIITFVLCYELITMITDRNNLHDVDTWMFFKWFFKAFVAVYLVTNTFDIVMAVFDVGQHLVNSAAGVIGSDTAIDIATTIEEFNTQMETMELGELFGLAMETSILSLAMKIVSILITVVLYGRMIEIYLYTSVAPVPFATLANREWGQIGNNYVRGLIALGFQGFFIMVIVGIYCVLIASMTVATNIHSALFSIAAYTVILCFTLFKTGSISKSIFHLTMTYHIKVAIPGEDGMASTLVTNSLMERYGVTAEQLHEDAMKNSQELMPMKFAPMATILFGVPEEVAMADEQMPLMVMTNEEKMFGASALFYPEAMDQLAEKMGGNYFVLPSSVHEVIVLPNDGNSNVHDLEQMVQEVNSTQVEAKDQLSDRVYHYDARERTFELAENYEKRMKEKARDKGKEERTEKQSLRQRLGEKKKESGRNGQQKDQNRGAKRAEVAL